MEWKITNLYVYEIQKYLAPLWHLVGICMTIMCHNDELSSTMGWLFVYSVLPDTKVGN